MRAPAQTYAPRAPRAAPGSTSAGSAIRVPSQSMPCLQSMPQVIALAPSAILMIARNLRWRQVRSPKPVGAAGGAAAIPLTTVVYAATSLTFQRAAPPRRSWQPSATWPSACSPNRTGQFRRAPGSTAATLADPDQARIKRTSRKNARALAGVTSPSLGLQQPPRLLLIPGVVGQRLRDRFPHLVSERLILRLRGCCSSRHPRGSRAKLRGRLGH